MILANGVGTALFILIVYNVISEQEKVLALQAQKTLRIANQTLSLPTNRHEHCHCTSRL